MPIFEWDEKLSLGHDLIDGHHLRIVEMINTVYDAAKAEPRDKGILAIIDELVDYATYHFGEEENWMMEMGYPDLVQHRRQHQEFSLRVQELRAELEVEAEAAPDKILTFLVDWFANHIMASDMDYGRFATSAALGSSSGTDAEQAA